MKEYKIVIIEWTDACYYRGEESIDWLQREASPKKVVSVGFLLIDDKNKVIISNEILSDNLARGTSAIPKKMVNKITFLNGSVKC